MKKILVLLLTLLLLAGCRAQPASVDAEQPASGVPGYYALSQVWAGGSGAQADLLTIEVSRRQEDTIVELRFDGENGLPSYSVSGLSDPARLVIALPLSSRSFAGREIEPNGLFEGMFYEQDGENTVLYLQFTGNIAYKPAEDTQTLTFFVRADALDERMDSFVRLSYGEKTAPIAQKHEMTPALCDDGATVIYLSRPFASQQDAEALRQSLEEELLAQNLDDTPQVSLLQSGAAPEYMEPISRRELSALGALLRADESVLNADVFMVDARFLCWLPDGKTAVLACPTNQDEAVEEVWLCDLDGNSQKLFDGEFSALQKGAVSSDGRYFALIEQLEGARLVYVYDKEQGTLDLLSTQGFGDYTTDIAWSAEDKLYAMTGDDVMQLMVYDPALSGSETASVSAVEEREGSYGTIGCAGGWVYFTDEYGDILRANPQTATRELFVPGDGFWISGDGEHMAVVLYVDQEGGEVNSYIDVYTPTAKQVARLEIESALLNACWDRDGQKLYYLLANYSNAAYPTELFVFDILTGKSESLGMLASKNIFTGAESSELMLVAYLEQNGALRPVCYRLHLQDAA